MVDCNAQETCVNRPVARGVDDPAARRCGQRQPVEEVRTGDERVVLVVEEFAQRRARGDQQVVESAERERPVRAFAQRGQVPGIQRGEVVVHAESWSGRAIIGAAVASPASAARSGTLLGRARSSRAARAVPSRS